jgi:hypothetical protein
MTENGDKKKILGRCLISALTGTREEGSAVSLLSLVEIHAFNARERENGSLIFPHILPSLLQLLPFLLSFLLEESSPSPGPRGHFHIFLLILNHQRGETIDTKPYW